MEAGLRLLVTVETVFDGGFVASYVHPKDSRDVFRGALLQSPPPSSQGDFKCEPSAVLITPESNFANPVGVVHDHPYSDYFRRAEVIVKSVPKKILLHWNSVGNDPRRGDDPTSTNFGVASRQIPHDQKNCKDTPIILCDPASIPSSISTVHLFPYTNEHGQCVRRAKSIAKLKLESCLDRVHETCRERGQVSASTKSDRKSCKASKKKDHPNQRHTPVAKLQSKKACSDRVQSANAPCPRDQAAQSRASAAGLGASTVNLRPITTLSNSHEAEFSTGSTDSSSLWSGSQETDMEDDVSCTSSASLTDPHTLPGPPLRHKIGRKRAHNSLKSCTVDVVRCKKSAPSSLAKLVE